MELSKLKESSLASDAWWLDIEIAQYQTLVENAYKEVNAGNERMRSYLEAYANHRDSLIEKANAIKKGQ